MTFPSALLTALTCMVAVLLAALPTHFTTTGAAPEGLSPGPTRSTPAGAMPAGPHTAPERGGLSPGGTSAGPSPDQASGLPPPDAPLAFVPLADVRWRGLPLARPTRFGWPLAPPHPVARPFLAPSTPYGPGHRGVDLGGQPNEPVLAAGDGVVAFAGVVAGRGVVSIDHAGGLRTTYEPLTVLVSTGMRVNRGTVVGHLTPGHQGCVDAPACLHWGARRGTEYLDPLGLLSTGRVRLLPWEDGRR